MSEARPRKVAIVGGGCAAMAAAFELSRPEHAGQFAVTVYQQGFRLGGKGASGRGVAGRIEEHGLHLWMGFYENAFRLLRECYAELDRDPASCPIADWRDAFAPAPLVGVTDRDAQGEWVVWQGTLPPNDELPGDPVRGGRPSVADYMARSVALLRTLIQTLDTTGARPAAGHSAASPNASSSGAAAPADAIAQQIGRLLGYGELATLVALSEALGLLESVVQSLNLYPDNLVLRVLDAVRDGVRAQIEARIGHDLRARQVWQVIDLTIATLRGEIRFGVMTDPRGFDAIDEYDCREWLLLNGAAPSSVDCGFMRALYDLGFSYEDGDVARPRIAAGQALRSMVRAFFTYRGSFFWHMQAGMGDVVFAPFYEVLWRRGVRFEFFHRLTNVHLAAPGDDSPHVDALEFDVQARALGGAEYRPLVDVGGLPCWPARADHAQLEDGERLEREGVDFESHWDTRRVATRALRVGEDFDFVVLAVGLGAVPHVCRELIARDPRWRAMVDHVKTVATQAFQVWLSEDLAVLGWPHRAINVSGFVEPFDTFADMRHVIRRESWPVPPRALAYFCSVLPNGAPGETAQPEYAARQQARVRDNAVRFLNEDVARLWPRSARAPGAFRWELLVAPPGRDAPADETRFATQFWTANVNPSDRYVLSLPGSGVYRISPLDGTYDNLVAAGDWTDCGFNAGCVEAAVMSGRLAAHALSLSPALEDIVGFDHP